jgi:hypothetical protein
MKTNLSNLGGIAEAKSALLLHSHQRDDVNQCAQEPFRNIHKGDARRLLDLGASD